MVRAFRGIRYGVGDGSDLSALICPPYDVITEEMQAELYVRHPHNFVRIELPRSPQGADRYAGAARTLAQWREEGVMVREEQPAVYVLEQEFRLGPATRRRRGLLCLVRLPEEGHRYVLSHEGTLPAARADRLELMRACQAMTSPVMVIHEDAEGKLLRWLEGGRGEPRATASDDGGVRARLWPVSDQEEVAAAAKAVGAGPLVIADGHHRFETAMAYRAEMRARLPAAPPEAGFNYALMLIISAHDPGLAILPTHRLICGVGRPGLENLDRAIAESFEASSRELGEGGALPADWDEEAPADRPACAVYVGGDSYRLLTLREEAMAEDPSVVGALAVSIVHRHLLAPLFRDCDGAKCELRYVTDAQEAFRSVREGEAEAAVLLRPTRVAEVLAVARAGERMPGKSTYFYPKAPAGLVLSGATAEPIG